MMSSIGKNGYNNKKMNNYIICNAKIMAYKRSNTWRIFKNKIKDCGMLQPKDKVDYLVYFDEHQPKEALILDEVIDITIKDKKIVGWIVTTKKQLKKTQFGKWRKT